MNISVLIIMAYSLAVLVAITCLCIYIKWSKQKDREWRKKNGQESEGK